ncbi:helix-turn-helix domain-containing protein, partial [Streptomyces avidinii]
MPAPKELDPSASLAALYGAKLRKLRIRAGLTQRQLGDKIPIAHSRIAQFELGNEVPPEDVNGKLDVLLDADGDLIDLWGHIKRTPYPDWARRYMNLEQ